MHILSLMYVAWMKIGVIGASGFIGQVFYQHALSAGHEVVGYSRSQRDDEGQLTWRVFNDEPDLSGLDAIVNFAGESVAQRWSEEKKVLFHSSRVGVTKTIVKEISKLSKEERPAVLINSSAVGYYGDCGDQKLTEESPKGDGYLSDLCLEWENAALEAEEYGVRVVIGRIGIVLGKGGDAWEQMRTVFNLGGGGSLGKGTQWMPWVHVDDVAEGCLYACENDAVTGDVNLVSPDPMTNKEFTKVLASHLKRPAIMPVPGFALKMLYGEFGKHLLDSYRVYPKALQGFGYNFGATSLKECLELMD